MAPKMEFDTFDEQLRYRKLSDEKKFNAAITSMASAVVGERMADELGQNTSQTKSALEEILQHYHLEMIDLPEDIADPEEQLEYLLHPTGIMRRECDLKGAWWRNATGAYLAKLKEGGVVALMPRGVRGYCYRDAQSGKYIRINAKTAQLLEEKAVCMYRPLPAQASSIKGLTTYIAQTIAPADVVVMALLALATTLLGLLLPKISNLLFSNVIDTTSYTLLGALGILFVGVTISISIFSAGKNLALQRMQQKSSVAVDAAAIMRIVNLPTSFFKEHSSGELYSRLEGISSLCAAITQALLSSSVMAVLALLYLSQVVVYASPLLVPTLIIVILTLGYTYASTVAQRKQYEEINVASTLRSGKEYALLKGIQKIKLCGAERRAFAQWAGCYHEEARLVYDPPFMCKLATVVPLAITLFGTIVLYHIAALNNISVADYYAFNTAYALLMGSFAVLQNDTQVLASIQPLMRMAQPILEEEPEVLPGRKVISSLSGGIEFSHVTFAYDEGEEPVVKDLSLKIRPGQYVAIVGPSGCGKSTLIRLMMGFESPQKGSIYYDGRDLSEIDLRSLRRNIGTVEQDGKIFPGDILTNITATAPLLGEEEAWEAARIAYCAEEIKAMPMGMHTYLSDGSVSVGQRQRIMIARAVVHRPKVLLLDEATSALDNISQRNVSDALDELHCTRIAVAHRLSTVKECDRILVLDKGQIVEEGTFEDLMSRDGLFASLMANQ